MICCHFIILYIILLFTYGRVRLYNIKTVKMNQTISMLRIYRQFQKNHTIPHFHEGLTHL